MEKKKIYYHDEKNDLTEYIEGSPDIPMTVASWVNPYLVLLFDIECKELTVDNIVGFQINGIRHLLQKAEEQASVPLTPEQEKEMNDVLAEIGYRREGDKKEDTDN